MKLQSKMLLSQIIVFLMLFIFFISMLPQIVYLSVSRADREETMEFSNQVMTNIEHCMSDAKRFSEVVADDAHLKSLIGTYMKKPSGEAVAQIELYLSQMRVTDHTPSYRIQGIQVNFNDANHTFFSTVGLAKSIQDHINESVLPTYYEREYSRMIIDPFEYMGDTSTIFGNQFNYLYGYVNNYHIGEKNGTVTIIASYDEIYYIADKIESYCHDYKLVNADNRIIEPFANESSIDVDRTLENMLYGDTFYEGYCEDSDGFSTITLSNIANWKLICRLTKRDIIQKNQILILVDGIIMAVFAVLATIIMLIIIRKFLRPLRNVSEQMGELAKGNLNVRINVQSKDEVGEVATTFNYMTGQLERYIHTVIEKEQLEQKMRYSILISQVDPHFIYNTMNTITYLAEENRNKDIVVVNKAMIEILKDRLRIEISDVYDTVEQEINVVRKYLIIQNYRYEGTFKTEIEVEDELWSCYIAKNILQPLVENALNHGILSNKDEDGEILGGCIKINVQKENNSTIQISVSDNGAGMSKETLDSIENEKNVPDRGKHIGIRNIRERINFIYKEKAKIQIESVEEEGTIITLLLPLLKTEE